jgi:hypothetical protein
MKLPGCRVISICLAIVMLMILPVSANPIIHHATIVYFEQDNESINDQVAYSLNCTGHSCREWDCTAPEDQMNPAEYPQKLLLRESGICPPSYGCIISDDSETARHVNFHLDYCTVSGEIRGTKFVINDYPNLRYGCFLKGLKDGDGRFYTDYCEIHLALPSEIEFSTRNATALHNFSSSHTPNRPPILMKKGFVDEIYCNILSIFGSRC